jgi:hypothetical protein
VVWALTAGRFPLAIGVLLVLLYVPPIAHVLGHAGPSAAGVAVAAVSIPAVLIADALFKRFRRDTGDVKD